MKNPIVCAALTVGLVLSCVAIAGPQFQNAGLRINHVGIAVKTLDETVRFCTETLGFREAYTLRDTNGNPTMTAIQASRETFLKLTPTTRLASLASASATYPRLKGTRAGDVWPFSWPLEIVRE